MNLISSLLRTIPRVIPCGPSLPAVEFSLDAHGLHLVHLGDALAQVFSELAAVVLVAGVERRQTTPVHAAR